MADNFSIDLHELEEVGRRLGRAGKTISDELYTTMDKAMQYIHSKVPPYPAPPPMSRYTRTGSLGRSITTKVEMVGSHDVIGKIGSNIVYAPFVIGHEKQASVHKGRWYTLFDVVDKSMPRVRWIFTHWVNIVLGRVGQK
jgi:hypothetical protein